jgi:hypothetical protein
MCAHLRPKPLTIEQVHASDEVFAIRYILDIVSFLKYLRINRSQSFTISLISYHRRKRLLAIMEKRFNSYLKLIVIFKMLEFILSFN